MTRDQVTAAVKAVTGRAVLVEVFGFLGARVPFYRVDEVRELLSIICPLGSSVSVIPLSPWQHLTLWSVVWDDGEASAKPTFKDAMRRRLSAAWEAIKGEGGDAW